MDSIWAEGVWLERGGSLTPDQLEVIVELATGDKNKAKEAKNDRIVEWTHQGRKW